MQASTEKIAIEMSPIEETDIKVDSEEFCDANDDQANYDGTRWIIICLSTGFIVAFINCFMTIFSFL